MTRSGLAATAFLILIVVESGYAQTPTDSFRPAMIRFETSSTALLGAAGPVSSPASFDRMIGTEIELIRSEPTLSAAARTPEVAKLGMSTATLRRGLSTSRLSGTELVVVRVEGPDGKPSVAATNAVVNAYLFNHVDRDRRAKVDRLEKLQKLFEQYAHSIKTRKNTLRSLMEATAKPSAGLFAETAVRRLGDALVQQDRLELERVALVKRRELAEPRSKSEPGLTEFRKLTEDLAVVDAQLDRLRPLVGELHKLGESAKQNAGMDVEQERAEIELALESMRKIGRDLEQLELQLQEPSRVTIVQRASMDEEVEKK